MVRNVRRWRALLPIALALVLGACGADLAGRPTPREAVERADAALQRVATAHFVFRSETGDMPFVQGFTVREFEGDVVRPDRLAFATKARRGAVVVALEFRQIGAAQFMTNPLVPGQWLPIVAGISIGDVLTGISAGAAPLAAAADLRYVDPGGATDVDRIAGTIPAAAIAQVVGGNPAAGTVLVEFSIARVNGLPREMVIRGAMLAGEGAQAVKRVTLSRLGEPVSIERPL